MSLHNAAFAAQQLGADLYEARERIAKLEEKLHDAQTALVWIDAATEKWTAKAPLTKKHSTVLVRFINEFMSQVTPARQRTMKEIVLAIQDALDEIPQLPIDPEAADRVWVDAHGVPMNIDKIDPARLINILRFAYRGFLDRERPGQWENITAACEKYGKPWQEHLRKWDRDEREKIQQMRDRDALLRGAVEGWVDGWDARGRCIHENCFATHAPQSNYCSLHLGQSIHAAVETGIIACARHPDAEFTGGHCVDCLNERCSVSGCVAAPLTGSELCRAHQKQAEGR